MNIVSGLLRTRIQCNEDVVLEYTALWRPYQSTLSGTKASTTAVRIQRGIHVNINNDILLPLMGSLTAIMSYQESDRFFKFWPSARA